jgi:hypothetical protein
MFPPSLLSASEEGEDADFVRRGKPDMDGEGAASRGNCSTLFAAVPPVSEKPSALPAGTTVSRTPVLYVALARPQVKEADFLLQDARGQVIVRRKISLPPVQQPDFPNSTWLLPLPIPAERQLARGQVYSWTFSIICDPQRRDLDDSVKAIIQVMEPSPSLRNALEDQSATKPYAVYAKGGIWYEALSTLMDGRSHPEFRKDLATLLNTAGLSDISSLLGLEEKQ